MKANLRRGASSAALVLALSLIASAAAQAATIEGRVSDASASASLEGAIVRIEELGLETSSDRDGTYRFAGVPAGTYTVSVNYVGGARATSPVTVAATDAAALDFRVAGLGSEQIVVLGQRGSLFSALNRKRSADIVSDVLSADSIGQFPDQNVSEAARRVPGVSVANDQGEGRFVIIRGIDPNLNATSINGVRLPAPEGDERAVALDVIDSDVLSSITITKSTTPNMDGDAIGGTVNIETLSAFTRDGRFLSGELGGSYNELTERVGPKVSLTGSDVFMDGRLGVAGSLSWRERTFATDNQEVDGDWSNDDGVFSNEELELRDYIVTRERANATINFDYRLSETQSFYLRTLWSDFRDQEYRDRVEVKYDDACLREDLSSPGAPVFQSGDIDCDGDPDEYEFSVDRDLKDREETQQIYSATLGGESLLGPWTLDYSGSFSHAEEAEPNAIDTVSFSADFDDDGFFGQLTGDPLRPRLNRGLAGSINIDDADDYEMDEVSLTHGLTEDEEFAAMFDVRRDFSVFGDAAYFQFGGKIRGRDKERDVDSEVFEPSDDLALTDFQGVADYPLDTFGPAVRRDFRDYFNANRSGFELNAFDTALAQNVEDYTASEDIEAVYAMTSLESGPLTAIVGVRVEHTAFEGVASRVVVVEEDGALAPEFADYVEIAEDGDIAYLGQGVVSKDYTDFLPSLTLRYAVSEDFILRGAYYRALARPKFGDLVPSAEIDQSEDGEFEGSFGNPDLDRQLAENFDAAAEWYLGNSGILSVGAFYKVFDDFIAPTLARDIDYFGVTFDEASIAVNLPDASLNGVEFNYQQSLSMLPAPFDGILVGANYTRLDGEAKTADGAIIPLPRLSDQVANVVLGYDNGPFDVRLALSYRDDYLDELGVDGAPSRFADARSQLDLSGRYRLTDQVRLYAEVNNLTDESESYYYLLDDGSHVLSQYETYGYTANFGVKVQY